MAIPQYKRVILSNVSAITPDIIKQIKDNQEYLRWNYDNLPKGVIARKQADNMIHIPNASASGVPVNILTIDSVDLFANRVYKITLTSNGTGATEWDWDDNPGSDDNIRGSFGEIAIMRNGNEIRRRWVAGTGHVPDEDGNYVNKVSTTISSITQDYMKGSWPKVETFDFIYTDLPNATYSAEVRANGNPYYYNINTGAIGTSAAGIQWVQINNPNTNDWYYQGIFGTENFSNYTLIVEDMGSFDNDPWQYGGL